MGNGNGGYGRVLFLAFKRENMKRATDWRRRDLRAWRCSMVEYPEEICPTFSPSHAR
jgi:hypothetical protein